MNFGKLSAIIDDGFRLPVFPWEIYLQDLVRTASARLLAPLTVLNYLLADETILLFFVLPTMVWVYGTAGLAVGLAMVVTCTKVEAKMKDWFKRPRPRSIHHLDTTDYGIPSGDAMLVAAWTPLAFGWWALAPIFVVCWARLAREAHYPLDVVLGSVVGYGIASAFARL